MDPKTRHKIELMAILLVVTVIANIIVYFVNKNYEEPQMQNLQQEQTNN
ncbi:MAG: hypothetical protein ACOCXQ_03305 [Patescibacteria group bacterium]